MDNFNYILRGISFIVTAFLFYRIIKKRSVSGKKKNLTLKICVISLLLVGCGTIILGFIPDEIDWKKEDENFYSYNDGRKQINIVTNDDMSFNFDDFLLFQSDVLSTKGYLVERLEISKFQEWTVNRYINSYYKDTNSSNAFVIFIVTIKKNKIIQNIYVGKIRDGKKDIHAFYLSASSPQK